MFIFREQKGKVVLQNLKMQTDAPGALGWKACYKVMRRSYSTPLPNPLASEVPIYRMEINEWKEVGLNQRLRSGRRCSWAGRMLMRSHGGTGVLLWTTG